MTPAPINPPIFDSILKARFENAAISLQELLFRTAFSSSNKLEEYTPIEVLDAIGQITEVIADGDAEQLANQIDSESFPINSDIDALAFVNSKIENPNRNDLINLMIDFIEMTRELD